MGDMHERSRQRQQREKQRQKRQQMLRLRLLIAFGILLVCGIVILAVSTGRGQTELPPETTGVQQEQVPGETEAPVSKTTVIHFAAGGDLNVTDKVVASGGAEFDYTATFMDVLPLLSKADLTALNFEGNVCGAPYGANSAPQQMLDALQAAGVDLLQLANSKAINMGMSGLNATVRNVRAAGMASVGLVAEGEAPGAYVIRYVNGVKVAVVAVSKTW